MRVLLINPHDASSRGFSNPPLGLAYLAGSLVSAGIDVDIADGYIIGREGILEKAKAYKPNIAGINCYTPGRHNVLDIAKSIKAYLPQTKIVLGGAHPTIMWKQILSNYPYVDMCVLSEGEHTIVKIAEEVPLSLIDGIAYRNINDVVMNPKRSLVEDLDSISFPAWDLVEFEKYPQRSVPHGLVGRNIKLEPYLPVIFSRGCIGSCAFCSTWWIWQGFRNRSPGNMVDELEHFKHRYGIEHFIFEDDLFSANIEAAKVLCDEINRRKLEIAWFATTRVDCVDEELLRKMKSAGCYTITFGVETGSQRILDSINKKTTVNQAEEAIVLAKEAGLYVEALLIVGNIGETEHTINETIDFLKKTKPDSVGTIGGLWIFPGTRIYESQKRAGLMDDSFWLGDARAKVYCGEDVGERLPLYLRAIRYRAKVGSLGFRVKYAKELLLRFSKHPIGNSLKLLRGGARQILLLARLEGKI